MNALFQQKPFTNYISDKIDVGFHIYGPTLNLDGVISTPKKVCLIDYINITVKTPSEDAQKKFDWFALQPHSAMSQKLEITNSPSKFVLPPGKPYNYYIMFADNDRYAEMKAVLLNVISLWQGTINAAKPDTPPKTLFQEFCDNPMTQELNALLRRICYWEAGTYHIDIGIATKNKTFVTKKFFELNEPDVEKLKNNATHIIAGTCEQSDVDYHVVKVDLKDE